MLGQFPEAMILAGISQTPQARKSLQQSGIPVVQTMEMTDAPIDINIGTVPTGSGLYGTRHLFELGHSHVGQISAHHDSRSRQRIEGYIQACEEFGAAPMLASTEEPDSVPLGGLLLAELTARWAKVTAVFCGNDNLALGALFECQRRGILVPEDLSIIGFNDLEVAACSYPSLSSIATPRYEMAQRSAEIILEIIRGSGNRPKKHQIDLGFRLISRESTGKLSKLGGLANRKDAGQSSLT